jgi:hypothetical protein
MAGSRGVYTLHFTAHNGVGSDATQEFTLTVRDTVTVVGVSPTDRFSLDFIDATHFVVTFNGRPTSYDTTMVAKVAFQGVGQATAVVNDPSNIMTARVSTNSAQIVETGFEVDVTGAGLIYVYGNSQSTGFLRDSPGGTFIGAPGYSYVTGGGYFDQLAGFGVTYAYADGMTDKATFYLAPHQSFIATPTYGEVVGTGLLNVAAGFQVVSAYADASGSDATYLYLGPSGLLVASSTYGYSTASSVVDIAVGFPILYGYADNSGTDSAYFYSAAHASFVIEPTYSFLSGNGYLAIGVGFPNLYGIASGTGTDAATLFAGAGDTLVATPTYAYLWRTGFFGEAMNFGQVSAYGIRGQRNNAYLYDSEGDDILVAGGNSARLITTIATNSATNFDFVEAIESSGFDPANVAPTDFAFQLSGNWTTL